MNISTGKKIELIIEQQFATYLEATETDKNSDMAYAMRNDITETVCRENGTSVETYDDWFVSQQLKK